MQAIVKLALGKPFEKFGEMMVQTFFLQSHKTKSLDAGRIDEESSIWQSMHLSKGCGVSSLAMRLTDFRRFQLKPRNQSIDEGALANP